MVGVELQQYLNHKGCYSLPELDAKKVFFFKMERSRSNYQYFFISDLTEKMWLKSNKENISSATKYFSPLLASKIAVKFIYNEI